MISKNKLITGAEAVAAVLKKEGIKTVFAYPGTSELILCHAIQSTEGLHLINGRGDKESAFMAAGAGLIKPLQACAVLHGARGLTNACGAIADAKRNEVGTIIITGLPSLSSQPYLPPHGEFNLIENIGDFTKSYEEITSFDPDEFFFKLTRIISNVKEIPFGPVLLGIPQDVLERRFIPADYNLKLPSNKIKIHNNHLVEQAVELIKNSKNPLILIDDYLFKTENAVDSLFKFSITAKAPVFQVFYGRGPMLFEKLSYKSCPSFLGYYKINNPVSQKLAKNCDLFITIEDRNMYSRIVGKLPHCSKIAITSSKDKTSKNKYLKDTDIVIEGNISRTLKNISNIIGLNKHPQKLLSHWYLFRKSINKSEEINVKKHSFLIKNLVKILGEVFKTVSNPVIIDDSQMFGGMVAKNYDLLPDNIRIFGDHGAFVGAGISYATGLAISGKNLKVFCLLGDQAFVNGFQGLSASVENKARCIYIVLNNGESVSLFKQVLSQNPDAFSGGTAFLKNIPGFSYSGIAKALGLKVFEIENDDVQEKQFRNALLKSLKINGPVLIEIKVPSEPEAWHGVWTTEGNETK